VLVRTTATTCSDLHFEHRLATNLHPRIVSKNSQLEQNWSRAATPRSTLMLPEVVRKYSHGPLATLQPMLVIHSYFPLDYCTAHIAPKIFMHSAIFRARRRLTCGNLPPGPNTVAGQTPLQQIILEGADLRCISEDTCP
jgi:hypothetical protein